MLRKLLFGAVAAAGLIFVGGEADAGWRRDLRRGYYNSNYSGGYYSYRVPRRAWRNQTVYYNQPYNYGYSYPTYYGGNYGYYQQPYYGGVGVVTPGFGFYVR